MQADLLRELKTCARADLGAREAFGWNADAEIVVFARDGVMAVRTSAHPTGAGWRISSFNDELPKPAFAISLPTGDVCRYVRELANTLLDDRAWWPEPAGSA